VTKRPVGRESFDNIANVYDEIRPGYQRALYADLSKLLPPRPLILEVGPGTGQATRVLLADGVLVDAVEIGQMMKEPARTALVDDMEHFVRDRFDDRVSQSLGTSREVV
jgi:SAM-dependent methyltransferase